MVFYDFKYNSIKLSMFKVFCSIVQKLKRTNCRSCVQMNNKTLSFIRQLLTEVNCNYCLQIGSKHALDSLRLFLKTCLSPNCRLLQMATGVINGDNRTSNVASQHFCFCFPNYSQNIKESVSSNSLASYLFFSFFLCQRTVSRNGMQKRDNI